MAGRGLLSRITSDDPVRRLDVAQSILENIRALLSTRRGSAPACPEFGIEDLVDLVHRFPHAGKILERQIKEAIARYEPRLTQVTVTAEPSERPLVWNFQITAALASEPHRQLNFITELHPGGRLRVG